VAELAAVSEEVVAVAVTQVQLIQAAAQLLDKDTRADIMYIRVRIHVVAVAVQVAVVEMAILVAAQVLAAQAY
jgi:hypothetical protein